MQKKKDQPMFQHLEQCSKFQHCIGLMNLAGIDNDEGFISPRDHYVRAILENYKVIKTVHNYSLLAFSETYFVRKLQPDINDGLKACVDFRVFDF